MWNSRWLRRFLGMPLSTILAAWMLLPSAIANQSNSDIEGVLTKPSWQEILKQYERRDPNGRSGGPRPATPLCQVSPTYKEVIWTLHPVFVWQGGTSTIGVRDADKNLLLPPTASQNLTATLKQVRYSGKSLQPGQTYDWLFFFSQTSSSPMQWVSFRVMNAKEHASISADLTKLETPLKASNVTQEVIALQRANYFAQKKLWSDMLQEIYSVKNPSAELQQVARQIATETCQSKK